MSAGVHSVLDNPIDIHSRKPNEARKRIIELCGDLPRVELFAREHLEGFDVWGNQVDNSIVLGGEENFNKCFEPKTELDAQTEHCI